jgi:hypothetical protein
VLRFIREEAKTLEIDIEDVIDEFEEMLSPDVTPGN